jgi:hypothetical protein
MKNEETRRLNPLPPAKYLWHTLNYVSRMRGSDAGRFPE